VLKVISRLKFWALLLCVLNIKKCDSAMDEDLNPKVKVRGSSLHFCNL
jgi:hypothetical protein